MATVDIEPASLAVTPGEPQALTLTVRNDGDDVEAYHLTVVDDAAPYVVIEPDILLAHPGETVTAVATLTLEHADQWRQGDLIVRFHVVPAGRPDDFVMVEAIGTIESFSDVRAALVPPDVEGRRGGVAEVTLTNAGNTQTSAEVSASAGELALFLDQPRAALPADGAESIRLAVRARSLLWRGEPAQHPFVVTVSPEGGETISLEGTFTQVPVFARWAFVTAIAVGAVVVVGLLGWIGAAVIGGLVSGPSPTTAASGTSAAPSESGPPPEPDVRVVVAADDDDAKAGDPVAFTIEPDIAGAPAGSLLAMEVEWPEELTLTQDECEAWVAPKSDSVLEGAPRSGDECLIELSGGRTDAGLTFATPPAGFTGDVSARAIRLVSAEGDDVTTIQTGPDSDFGSTDAAEITLEPYPFWIELDDLTAAGSDGKDARVVIHRTLRGDGTDEDARLKFEITPPAPLDGIFDTDVCDEREGTTCTVYFGTDPGVETNSKRAIDIWFAPDGAEGIGLMTATATSLTDVPPDDLDQWVRGAEALLVEDHMFTIDVRLDTDGESGQDQSVTATLDVTAVPVPDDVSTYTDGTLTLGLELISPEGVRLVEPTRGCTLEGGVCTLPAPSVDEPATITLKYVVDDPFAQGPIGARGASLTYDPTTAEDVRDGRERPVEELPSHWIGGETESFPVNQ